MLRHRHHEVRCAVVCGLYDHGRFSTRRASRTDGTRVRSVIARRNRRRRTGLRRRRSSRRRSTARRRRRRFRPGCPMRPIGLALRDRIDDLGLSVENPVHERRLHGTRAHGIHADTGRRVLDRGRLRQSEHRRASAAEYAGMPFDPTRPKFDALFTIAPPPCCSICLISCFMHSHTPFRLMPVIRSPSFPRSTLRSGSDHPGCRRC